MLTIEDVSDFLLMKELLDMLQELESLSILQMPTGVNTSILELIKMYETNLKPKMC